MTQLEDLRRQLDAVDREIVTLFEKRMGVAGQIGQYKLERGLPVLDTSREEAVLASRAAMCQNETLKKDVQALYERIMALSREKQAALYTKEV